jgi:hypothetical protein
MTKDFAIIVALPP